MKCTNCHAGWRLLFSALLILFGSDSASAKSKVAWFENAVILPFVIEARPFESTPPRTDESELLRQLSEAATLRAAQNIKSRSIAGRVERTTARQADKSFVVVSGSISLPVSLPRRVIGWEARSRDGIFARTVLTMTDASGKIMARQAVALSWDDVRWLRGTHSTRRNRALDDVLLDYVRRCADDAVKRLAEQHNR